MPRFPDYAQRTQLITGSVFEKFRATMTAMGDDLVKLHIGDSHTSPMYPLPIDPEFIAAHPDFNRYCDTFGILPLREAIAEKVRDDNNLPADASTILVTAGASNALSVAMQALVDPGDDVMVLSPYWPFFRGMVRMAGGNVIEVPFYAELYANPQTGVRELLESRRTPGTVAVYLNSPNNPSGKTLSRPQLETIADFIREHGLWLISDEAYDGMVYDNHEHISPASFPGMFERTISVFTFSKVFMFSGARIGYVATGNDALKVLNKTMVHQVYSPATLTQQMMVDAVHSRWQWREEFVAQMHTARDACHERLRVPAPVPDGAYYLFFPIDEFLNGRSYEAVVDECLQAGVSVAPGGDFGEGFANYIRVCFAGEPPARVETAIDRLNTVLGV